MSEGTQKVPVIILVPYYPSSCNMTLIVSHIRSVPHLDSTTLNLDNGIFYGFDTAIRYKHTCIHIVQSSVVETSCDKYVILIL
jgi:hypothetical protein